MLEMNFCGATSRTGFIRQIKFPLCFLGDFSSKEVILTPKFHPEKHNLNCVIFLHASNVANSKLTKKYVLLTD